MKTRKERRMYELRQVSTLPVEKVPHNYDIYDPAVKVPVVANDKTGDLVLVLTLYRSSTSVEVSTKWVDANAIKQEDGYTIIGHLKVVESAEDILSTISKLGI